LLIQPFLSPLAWALALGVVAHPLHGWIAKRIKKPGLAAGVAVLAIAIALVAPAIFVGHNIVREASAGIQTMQSELEGGKWRERVAKNPRLSSIVNKLEQQAGLGAQLQGMAKDVGTRVGQLITGSAWIVVQLLLTFFVLFYLFRDRNEILCTVRSLVPLSEREADEVFQRVADTIHATIFGTLAVALVQGSMGGLMFWWLGLPAPVLWGAIMALLSIIPVLGAFIIWMPAAVFLAMSGDWGKAAILTAWGGIVVALIDNLLFPILVGKRMCLHTLPVFFAILGGLAVFGAAGLILGPVILALTDAIMDIWWRRTAQGKPAEQRGGAVG
jgi:predicted PurR-regulated permease PerM